VLAIRSLLAQRRFALLLCFATLLLKLVVPTGYMIASDAGRPSIVLCSGVEPKSAPKQMSGMRGAMPGHEDSGSHHGQPEDHERTGDHGKSEMPCAFAGLSAAALSAIDPLQLAALIAFVMAIGLAGVVLPPLSASAHLRPPLRGPPAAL
jgi:hypothetical protein